MNEVCDDNDEASSGGDDGVAACDSPEVQALRGAGVKNLEGVRVAAAPPPAPTDAAVPYLHLMQEIHLKRVSTDSHHKEVRRDREIRGRLDHFAYDPEQKLLYLACLGDDSVAVVDAYAGCVRETISLGPPDPANSTCVQAVQQPQGLLYVPETRHLYVANARDGKLRLFKRSECGNKHVLNQTLGVGKSPDNLRFVDGHVYVGTASAIAVVRDELVLRPDPNLQGKAQDLICSERQQHFKAMTEANLTNYDTWALCGDPESFQLERGGLKRIFINVADARLVQVLASATGATLAKWPLPEGLGGNFPMCLDEEGRTLFVGVRKPVLRACVLALSTDDGRIKAQLPCAADSDDLCFDARRRRVYAVGGIGRVTVIDAARLAVLGEHETALGARTGFWYPERDSLYVAAPATASTPARLLVFHASD